jgi:WD40-like Beta Propeller Repeat
VRLTNQPGDEVNPVWSDGSVRTVASFDGKVHGGVSGLSISPDGKWLIYPLVTQRGSDLMMIKNFR